MIRGSSLDRTPIRDKLAEQLRGLAAASIKIAAAANPAATLQEITDQARHIVGANLAATHSVMNGTGGGASVAVSLSDKHQRFAAFDIPPDGTGIYRLVIEGGQPLRLNASELTSHEGWRGLGGYKGHPPLRGLLAVPIKSQGGDVIGVIMLSDKEDGEFTAEDEAILVQLAQIASNSIQNSSVTQALRASEERLRATQEHANIAIGEVDENGRFIAVNGAFAALTGYSREQLLGLTFFDFTHPDDIPIESDKYARQKAGELATYSLEKRYIR
jgi:GAF domain-containing protein